ncbi:MAG: CBS domain-containing protein [Bacillota bacterium]|nr:CBS domain-containing protein [Bacillota bacterium]
MQLTPRQLHIVEIVKRTGPIAAEELASQLHLSRAAIRSDLSILAMSGYLEARPRVGYTYLGQQTNDRLNHLRSLKVRDVQSVPVVIKEDKPLYDAIVTTFLEDRGTLFVVDARGHLTGAVSRSDLLRSAIGQMDLGKVPVGVIMTRVSNLITLSPEESVFSAAHKLRLHGLTALPVTRELIIEGTTKIEVTGVISLGIVSGLLAELAESH